MEQTASLSRAAYSTREASIVTGIGRTKLYEEISAGRLRVVKVGRRTLVPAKAIADWLSNLEAIATA